MASNQTTAISPLRLKRWRPSPCKTAALTRGTGVKYDVSAASATSTRGVLAGLTEISDIIAKKMVDGQDIPCDGKLYYRGIDVEKLVAGALKEGRFGFEETAYLLLLAACPTRRSWRALKTSWPTTRSPPGNFVRDVILKAPSQDIMNSRPQRAELGLL